MKKLVIFGTGKFAEVARCYFEADGGYRVVAFCLDAAYIDFEHLGDLPVVPFETLAERFSPSDHELFIAIGYKRMGEPRAAKCQSAMAMGYRLASYVSSKVSTLQRLEVGWNCFILEANTIQPFVKIGNDVIIWSGNHIGHHTSIGDHVFITSHVCIGGSVEIGEHAFLGMNATIRDGISVTPYSLIGAGALILKDTEPRRVYSVKGTQPRDLDSMEVDI